MVKIIYNVVWLLSFKAKYKKLISIIKIEYPTIDERFKYCLELNFRIKIYPLEKKNKRVEEIIKNCRINK